MRVLMLSNHYLPQVGGAEFYTHNLAEALQKRGHSVRVMGPALRGIAGEVRPSYGVTRFRRWPGGLERVGMGWQIGRARKKQRFDVLHCQMLYRAGYEGVLYGKMADVPVIVTPHGADIHTYEPLEYGLLRQERYRVPIVKTVRGADGITYTSDMMRADLLSLGADSSKCYQMPNGTAVGRFDRSKKTEFRKELGIAEGEQVFLTISRNSPIKGLDVLVDALGILHRQGHVFKAIIAGSDVERLSSRVEAVGLVERVVLESSLPVEKDAQGIPSIPSDNVVRLMVASDYYISPSLSGSYELSTLDALAAGLPLVVGDGNGSMDLCTKYGAGHVVPNGDAEGFAEGMERLLTNPDETERMAEKAITIAPMFDWEAVAERCEGVYEEVVAKKRSSHTL